MERLRDSRQLRNNRRNFLNVISRVILVFFLCKTHPFKKKDFLCSDNFLVHGQERKQTFYHHEINEEAAATNS